MKRKTGAAKARETIAEQRMREAAKEAGSNKHNFGSTLKKGSAMRGKLRSPKWKVNA